MAYLSQADLNSRLGAQTVLALFDDDGSATVNASAIASVCAAASARVDSFLARNYKGTLPLTVSPLPAMVVEAALEWAVYMSFRRKPEYLKAYYGDEGLLALMKNAADFCEKLADAKMLIPDATTMSIQNTGGIVVDNATRLIIDSADGTSNAGDL